MEECIHTSQNISEIFRGKCVLVTGATGFLGKVLVEKILRSCPGVKELFILLRQSEKGDVNKRLQDFLQHQVFDKLRSEECDALQKVRAIGGDITAVGLGLSEWHFQKVISEVSFIFHCAANVRFDDEPRNTLSTNLLGVKNIVDISKLCSNLEALVHVSTAFSFCNHQEISEQLYPEQAKPDRIIEALDWMNDDQLCELCKYYAKNRPSLYHLSKALAEIYIAEYGNSLPVIIIRPSIVTASVNEPFPGWIDNYNGPSGFIAVSGKGIVKTLLVEPDVQADWVPVDIVANTLIVAAHYIAIRRLKEFMPMELNSPNGVPIINCTCPEDNAITWLKIINICIPILIKYPSIDVYDKPGGIVTSSTFRYTICRWTSHYMPAFLTDTFYFLIGKKSRNIRLYKKIHRVMGHLEHYTTHAFVFQSPNMHKLKRQMSDFDRSVFPIDQNALDWNLYIENYVLGVRRYFLREKDETLAEARVKMMRMHYLWSALKISSVLGIFLFCALNPRLRCVKSFLLRFFPSSYVTCFQHKFLTK